MKRTILLATLPLVLLCACNKDSAIQEKESNTASFTAIANHDDTKTTITESGSGPYTYSMTWDGGEAVRLVHLVYPTPTETNTTNSIYFGSTYPFTNVASAGSSALFTPSSSFPFSFEVGDPFYVCGGDSYRAVTVKRASTDPADITVTSFITRQRIPANQEYTPSSNLGINANIIPIFGVVKKGEGSGFEPAAVQMSTDAAIVKFVVTNNSGSNKTIGKITMAGSSDGLQSGIAGDLYVSTNCSTWARGQFQLYTDVHYTTINLNCNNTTIANGESKTFGFVVWGRLSRDTMGNLTWTVYDSADNNIASAQNLQSTGITIQAGKVYTKTCVIPAP